MTVYNAYHDIRNLLSVSCESPDFEAGCIVEHITGISHTSLPIMKGQELSAEAFESLNELAKRRSGGYPLQYLLGEWDFLDLTLSVGEGVLIPRPETELLCETAVSLLPDGKVNVLDLCAGSGCVGLGIASLRRNVNIAAIELSDAAMVYLRHNCERYPALNITPVFGDVLQGADSLRDSIAKSFDAIVSNPPYIPSGDIGDLSSEVKCEPAMALDGDSDGLVFYGAIARHWLPLLRCGGFAAVEIGIGQSEDVCGIFRDAGLRDITVKKDYSGIDRIVYGWKLLHT